MTISHRIIALLIAAWIPFCCCTIRSAAGMVSTQGAATIGCCCQVDVEDCDPAESPAQGDDCASCCLKVLPDPPQDWDPPIDVLGHPILEAMHVAAFDVMPEDTLLRTRAPDPPPAPWARPLLEQGCLLLV